MAVLWIVILLTLIVTVVAQSGMIDTRITHVAAERVRCKWACRAGLEMATALLNDDELEGGGDSLYDMWNIGASDSNSVSLDGCVVAIEVIDESSKLNINTVTKEQLIWIPDMTEEIADSIIDWRDSDDEPSLSGAESGYYINLPFGYEARNGNFKTVRELLLVKDITPGLFYGDPRLDERVTEYNLGWINYFTCYSYDLNKDSEGNDRVNVNSASESDLTSKLGISQSHASWIVQNRQFDSIADLVTANSPSQPQGGSGNDAQPLDLNTYYDIVDKVTVTDDDMVPGRVNINTASRDVLTALLEGEENVAYDIISYRQSLEGGLESIGDLKNIPSVTVDLAAKFIDSITTRSSVYMVNSTATANATGISRKLEAVVDRDKSPVEILYFRAGAIN